MVCTFTAHAELSAISVEAGKDGTERITVLISRNSALATNTSDALIKSPLVRKVGDAGVPTGYYFQGEGFTLTFNSQNTVDTDIIVTLDVNPADDARLTLGDGTLSATATGGAIRNFYQALLASSSFSVVKSNDNQVFLLEGTSLNDPNIRCEGGTNSAEFTSCMFEVKK